jgi:hypothetical protein
VVKILFLSIYSKYLADVGSIYSFQYSVLLVVYTEKYAKLQETLLHIWKHSFVPSSYSISTRSKPIACEQSLERERERRKE